MFDKRREGGSDGTSKVRFFLIKFRGLRAARQEWPNIEGLRKNSPEKLKH